MRYTYYSYSFLLIIACLLSAQVSANITQPPVAATPVVSTPAVRKTTTVTTPRVATSPTVSNPQPTVQRVDMSQPTSVPMFRKSVSVTVPNITVVPNVVSGGAPLKETSAAAVHNGSGSASAGSKVGNRNSAGSSATVPTLQGGKRKTQANSTFVSADTYLEKNTLSVRKEGEAPPSPPGQGGNTPGTAVTPLTTTAGDILLLLGLCVAYLVYHRRVREAA